MKRLFPLVAPLLCLLWALPSAAADYRVEKLDEPAPSDEVTEEIAAQLSERGVRVIRGESRVLCDIWLAKELDVPNFDTTFEVLYPFQSGQLLGVIRFARRSDDFREQRVSKGVYTMRYEQQPVDGAHVGTSPTRDFVLLVDAQEDESAEALEYDPLTERSADVAGSTHPALFSLQRAVGEDEAPAIRHDQQNDWWIVSLATTVKAGDMEKTLPIDLVIVGHTDAI